MELRECATIMHDIITRITRVNVTIIFANVRIAAVRGSTILVVWRFVVVIVVNVAVQVIITVVAKDKVDWICRRFYASNTRLTYLCRGATTTTQATTW